MKLGKDVLASIVLTLQQAIIKRVDISEQLRNLDLVQDPNDKNVLILSKEKEE